MNPAAPERIPGGSSSGSAAAVGHELADLALGTDTGGSVRVPAALCGVLGLRPSHGRVSTDRAVPLAPSFDTTGWFARSGEVLAAAGRILLEPNGWGEVPVTRLLLLEDGFSVIADGAEEVVRGSCDAVATALGLPVRTVRLDQVLGRGMRLQDLADDYRALQGVEAWAQHHQWLEAEKPTLAPAIAERFRAAARVDSATARTAAERREKLADAVARALGDGDLLVLPATPGSVPRRDADEATLTDFHRRTQNLTALAGLARCPQLTVPLGWHDGAPLGLGLVGTRGGDEALLDVAERLTLEAVV